jgi:hypothetical protein
MEARADAVWLDTLAALVLARASGQSSRAVLARAVEDDFVLGDIQRNAL